MNDGNAADDPPGSTGAPPPAPLQSDQEAARTSSAPPKATLEEQVQELIKTRGYDPTTAEQVATTWKCEQCECALGMPRKDDCMCPCHCDCCCAGLFRCFIGCECKCPDDCHYEPENSEEDATADDLSGSDTAGTGSRGRAQGDDQDEQQESKKDEDGDETMNQKPENPPRQWPLGKLYGKLSGILNSEMHDDDANQEADQYAQAYFGKLYAEALQNGMKQKENSALPAMTLEERDLLLELMRVLVVKQVSLQKFTAAVTDVVRTSFRSTWTLSRILKDRCKMATAPPAVGPNAWGQKLPNAKQATLAADLSTYRFDRAVFSEEEVARLRKLCEEKYPFATATRRATADEWVIILGIMSGTIAARVAPEFMKRCCNLMQFQYVHYQVRIRAQGELYVKLPSQAKIFDFNQTSKRLSDTILAAVDYQKVDGQSIKEMLAAAKALSYDDELKTIHIFFDSKADAVRWEGMAVPFRNFKLQLQNPDARYREIQETETGEKKVVIREPRDGLQDNRYDTFYRLLCGNVTPTMDIDKLAKFLNDLTGGAIKMGAPTDSYGATSEQSLIWLFLAHTNQCPPALRGVNRILWKGHAIMITHPGRAGAAPCHQCAEVGHQMSACPKKNPADWISDSTIVVTAEMVDKIQTVRSTWTTPEEARRLFDSLGDHPASGPKSDVLTTLSNSSKGPETGAEITSSEGAGVEPGKGAGQRMDQTLSQDNSTNLALPADGTEKPSNTEEPKQQQKDQLGTQSKNDEAAPMTTPGKTMTKPDRAKDADSQGWLTAMSRMANNRTKKGQQNNQPQPERNGQSNRLNIPHTAQGPQKEAANQHEETNTRADENSEEREAESSDDSDEEGESDKDEEDSEAEDGQEGKMNRDHTQKAETSTTSGTGEPPSSKSPRKQQPQDSNRSSQRQQRNKQLPRREEEDALDAAIDRSNMERVGLTALRLAQRHRPVLDKAACLAAITTARADTSRRQSSQKGTLEAIHGTLVHTPPTANKNRDEMIEIMMLLKFLLYLSNRVDPDVELGQTNATALLEKAADEVEGLTKEELMAKIAEHYAQVATSSSELNHILPESLWGRTDCIRLLAKALRRSIYVIVQSGDPDVVHHMVFQPQRIKDHATRTTVASATINQPGYHEWLGLLQREIEADITPIVISHRNEHYNAVLLHHDAELTQRKVPTKETTLTKLWGPALVTAEKNEDKTTTGKTLSRATEDGMTLTEMIHSQSSVHPPEVFRALSQDNWSRHEKKAAIDALVHGQDRIKELLAFCDANTTTDASSSEHESKDEDMDNDSTEGSNAAYEPSQSSEFGTGESDNPGLAEDDDMRGETQGSEGRGYASYRLPSTPADTTYDAWAQVEWGRIVDEWAGQDGIEPPRLDQRSKLAKFAKDHPEVMAELGRNHPNPTVVLEHFTDDGIKDWCRAKRLRYVLGELTHIIAEIESEPVRQILTEWRLDVQAGTDPTVQTKKYRDKAKWDLLRLNAKRLIAERPLFTRDFTKDCASVLALDELFPDLAKDIFQATGTVYDDGVDLIQAYESVPSFKLVVNEATKNKQWEPIVDYIRRLGVHLSQPDQRAPAPSQY